MKQPIIKFEGISKNFNNTQVLDDVSFEIEEGKFYTLLGPSGCGKTTILKLIAGFETPTKGNILFNNNIINKVPANNRKVNTVFQDYALFPHLNVYDNVAFGLKIKKLNKKDIQTKVKEALKLVKLEGYEQRKITEMSGGQKQRVAIARAIANQPKVLIADEPTGNLDPDTAKGIMDLLELINREQQTTVLMVTHDRNIVDQHRHRTIKLEAGYVVADFKDGGYIHHV